MCASSAFCSRASASAAAAYCGASGLVYLARGRRGRLEQAYMHARPFIMPRRTGVGPPMPPLKNT